MTVTSNQTQTDGINVGMGEIKVASKLTDSLVAHGLGACVGLCMYDTKAHIIGIAHIVLPEFQPAPSSRSKKEFPGKFASEAPQNLIDQMCKAGSHRSSLVAAIAGGAHILIGPVTSSPAFPRLGIGMRCAQVIIDALAAEGIPLLGRDIGGHHGRTLTLRASDGAVMAQPIGSEHWQLICVGKDGPEGFNAASRV
jgi:chemotaxis protein CheD